MLLPIFLVGVKMAIIAKTDICNLALGHLGNYGTITNIDTPTNAKERTFNLWYDITRQDVLKRTMPNFALSRRVIAALETTIPFGYSYAFEYPTDCLKILGFGEIADTGDYIYSVEGGVIYTDDEWEDGLQLRFVKDIEDVTLFSPEFKMVLSYALASNVALDITQDINKKNMLEKELMNKMLISGSLNSQENKIVRISRSLFNRARRVPFLTRTPEQK